MNARWRRTQVYVHAPELPRGPDVFVHFALSCTLLNSPSLLYFRRPIVFSLDGENQASSVVTRVYAPSQAGDSTQDVFGRTNRFASFNQVTLILR